jgi:protein SCO1/2
VNLLRTTALALLAATTVASAGGARAVAPLPVQFDGVDVKNKLGQKVDLDIPLVSRKGDTKSLGQALAGDRPVLLTLNYFRCTTLCSVQLNELMKSLAAAAWLPGEQPFRVVTISFDPTDTAPIAEGKRESYTRELLRTVLAEDGGEGELAPAALNARADALDWEFYVAREKSIRALAESLGYYFKFDETTQQYAHSPVTYVLRPDGTINRYLFGLAVSARDLKFALMESSEGTLGDFGEKILLSCFAWDEAHGGYAATAWTIMRVGASGAAVVLGLFLLRYWRRERRSARAAVTA